MSRGRQVREWLDWQGFCCCAPRAQAVLLLASVGDTADLTPLRCIQSGREHLVITRKGEAVLAADRAGSIL